MNNQTQAQEEKYFVRRNPSGTWYVSGVKNGREVPPPGGYVTYYSESDAYEAKRKFNTEDVWR